MEITDKGVKSIVNGFKNLISLQNINLRLTGLQKITDNSLKSVFESLMDLTSLTSITLNFRGCKNLSGKDLKNVDLKRLSSVRSFSIEFMLSLINDQGLKNLTGCFQTLTSLQSFKLYLLM